MKTITIFWYFNFCMPISCSKCQDNSYWSCFICNFSCLRIAYTCIRSFDQINVSQILSFPFLHYLSITFSSQHHMFLVFLLNTQNLLSTACVYMNVSTYTRIFVASQDLIPEENSPSPHPLSLSLFLSLFKHQ